MKVAECLHLGERRLLCLRKAIWDYTNDISLEQDEVVSLILKSRKDYNRMRNTLFYQNVARDGIELYGRAS